ncbi:MAG: hypothetical protein AAF990_09465 [Bacteroidota bacterium]
MRISSIISFACLVLLFSACRKDQEIVEINKKRPTPALVIETVVQGIISDRAGNPLENVLVEFDQQQLQTDANGYFFLKGNAPSNKALIHIQKDGFFHTVHAFTPQERDTVRTEIKLIERISSGSFASADGGSIQLDNGSSVDFQAGGFVDASGNPYTGNVTIYAHPLDPTDDDIAEYMPGDMTARDAQGEEQLLESFGMVNVEIEDENGQALQINKPATLKVAVPASLSSNAPAEIPLWYFDEVEGLWIEEGSATLENGIYTGDVSHFTFWNCDIALPIARIDGFVRMGEYAPIVEVCITRSNGDKRCKSTSARGAYDGLVPQGETFLLEVLDHCGNVLHSQNIGPFTADSQIDPINLANNGSFTLVYGSVVDCNNDLVTSGYGVVHFEGDEKSFALPINANGRFFGMLPNCSATHLEVFATDRNAQEFGNSTRYQVSPTVNVDTIVACGNQYTESVQIEYNGNTYFIDNCIIEHTPNSNIYTFSFIDNQNPVDRVAYQYTMLDWNQDPSNPLWSISYNITQFGNPDPIFGITGDIQVVELGTKSGEIVVLEITNAQVVVEPNGNTYQGGFARLTGLIK